MRIAAVCLCGILGTCAAGDFRVESKVFEGDDEAPLSTNLTIFRAGVVYDLVETAPREATVFDPHRGRLVLIDPERKCKAEISTAELTSFSAEVRQKAKDSRDALLRFVAEPTFEVVDVVEPARVEFRSPLVQYSVVGQPCEEDSAAAYREFADWYAQLNTLTRRTLPPFARLEVNRQLAERSQVPSEVRLRLDSPRLGDETNLRSTHEFQWKLLASDGRTVDTIGRQMAEFQLVGLDEYQRKD